MFDRFGEEARGVVARARDEASGLGHAHVGTEHLLLGLVSGPATLAYEALSAAGASLASVREKVVEALASRTTGRPGPAERELPFSDRANRALDRAGRLALRSGHELVQAEHILLALLTVEGTAGQVLRGLAVDPEAVKAALAGQGPDPVEPIQAEPAAEEEPVTPRGATAPLCASCGAPLASSLERARISIGSGRTGDEVEVFYCKVCGSALGAR